MNNADLVEVLMAGVAAVGINAENLRGGIGPAGGVTAIPKGPVGQALDGDAVL